jgi:hypothetical protein
MDNGHRSLARLHARFEGNIGLTLQSAGQTMPEWTLHREMDSLSNYGKFSLPTDMAFGSGPRELEGAPTEEIRRFARKGKEKANGTRCVERCGKDDNRC